MASCSDHRFLLWEQKSTQRKKTLSLQTRLLFLQAGLYRILGRNLKSPTCYKNPPTTKTMETWTENKLKLPKVLRYKKGEGRRRQRTRSPVSRSSAHGAFEDKGGRKGFRGAPRCREEAHPKKSRPGLVPTPRKAQRWGRG